MKKTIESKAADTILETPEEITVAGKKYRIAPPTTATLILASEAISRLPHVRLETESVTEEVLATAKDCRALGEVVATLILGAKEIMGAEAVRKRRRRIPILGAILCRAGAARTDRRTELAEELLEELSPRALNNLTAQLLASMQLGDFFALTTFLTEVNLLKPTKVEETGATASGR